MLVQNRNIVRESITNISEFTRTKVYRNIVRKLIIKILEITRTKRYVKKHLNLLKHKYISVFKSYGKEELAAALKDLGVGPGDTILMHSSFGAFNGFKGSPQDVISVCLDLIGDDGNLLMVSMPYGGATLHYLQDTRTFNVKRTPSRMGIISEVFRRKHGVVRSLSPSHPVLAYGKDKQEITHGHDTARYPCGAGSPFERLFNMNGTILFYGVTFRTCTFMHYVEDCIKHQLPFRLYTEKSIPVEVYDYEGSKRIINVFPYSEPTFRTRRTFLVAEYLKQNGKISKASVGNTRIYTTLAKDVFNTAVHMIEEGIYFYDIQEAKRLDNMRAVSGRNSPTPRSVH